MEYEKYVYPYNCTSAKRDEALEQYQESYELNIILICIKKTPKNSR